MSALPWEDVSAREAEVLAAVGEHLTNAQIAGRLHISARTVESHVSALLRKCGASDRRQLAALAAEAVLLGARAEDAALPEARTSFVGRAEELESVRAALESSRLVTLTGPGGVGKTRLAVTTGTEVAPRFPAGVVYLDLVPVPPGQVVAAAANALGVVERPPRPLLGSVADRVRGRAMLLVLDNCEHVLDEVGVLVEALLRKGGRLRILATSRERLGVAGEQAHPVPPLPLGSAAETLFFERARGVDRAFTAAPALVTEACARLDGLPLAIELAAARAAAIGVDGLLTALDDRLRAVVGARGGEARHHSLGDVLGWSYDLLDPAESALFRRLAVFAAGFDLDAVAAVSPSERPSAVAHLIGRLVEKSLVARRATESTRYRLLETVRAFALEHFAGDEDRAEVLRAHLGWASRVAVELETKLNAGEGAARYDDVVEDLRAAFARTAEEPDPEAHRLGRALAHLTFARDSFVESRAHYRAAAARATSVTDAVRDLRSASEAAQSLADGDDAFDLLLAGAERAGDERDRAVMLALAVTLATRFIGDFRHAVPSARRTELLARAERAPVEDREHAAVLATARAWHAGADPAVAIEAAHEAGDPTLLHGALDSANAAAAREGRLREAYRLARERLDLLPALARHRPGDGIEMFDLFHSVSVSAVAVGDLPGALAIADRATEQDPVNSDYPFVSLLKYLAPLTLSGRFDDALELGERAFAEWRAAGSPLLAWLTPSVQVLELATGLRGDHGPWRARTLEFSGQTDARSGRLAATTAFVEARLAIHSGHLMGADRLVRNAFQKFTQPWYRAYANAVGAELAVLAQLPDAEKRLEQAERTAEENDWAAACVARARGRFAGEATAFRRSVELWHRIGARFELGRTAELVD
ncbi:LuxR C-terminal-related transcriptional regulator [Allokutzneria sp. NRRL B-24872]|uniref:ATP-binding protein n=1 Tax=Allokutzneria sp. NRRL B-24872 TaxID=1137961 RepID=UPI00143D8B13|nr:LuxR C-terminal-related transcriptional regulator [Allokutzneria sp. NRRL B-24872]